MSTRFWMRAAVSGRPRPPIPSRLRLDFIAALAIFLMTAGCSAAPPSPVAGVDPANPQARVRPVAYRSVIGPYVSQRPVEPAPWTEQNERVAPQPQSHR
jgi:hypothetical protein